MSVLNPHHLLEQAALLVQATPGRKPRQVNLRRAVSSAYYAVFHQVLIAAGDEFVGKSLRNERRYALVYRSIDHGTVRRVCEEAARPQPTPKYLKYLPSSGFEQPIRKFANIVLNLQSKRHDADYDPSHQLTSVDALFAVHLASTAFEELSSATPDGRKDFLSLLLFSPR